MKDSKKWEYDTKETQRSDHSYQDFRSHEYSECSVLFIKKDGYEYFELCFLLPESYESGKVAEIYENISLKKLNQMIKIFKDKK